MTTPLHQITAIVRDVLENPTIELTQSAHFDDILGCDSMDLVSIVVEAECRFDVLFLPAIRRAFPCRSPGRVVDLGHGVGL